MKTFSFKTPRAAERLAKQLDSTPEMILARAIWIGLHHIDHALADDCTPLLESSTDVPARIITGRTNRFTDSQLEAMHLAGRVPQKRIREAALYLERRQRRKNRKPATNIIAFHHAPFAQVEA